MELKVSRQLNRQLKVVKNVCTLWPSSHKVRWKIKAERELVGKLLMILLRGHNLGHSSVMDIVDAAGHDTGYCASGP